MLILNRSVHAEPVQMFAHGEVAPLIHLAPDARVFGFTVAVSLCAAAAFGLLPALRLSNPGLIGMLKDDAAWGGGRTTGATPRRWFVGGQVAVSMALLLAAGLLLRGVDASRDASTGYDTSRVFDVLYSRSGDPTLSLGRQTRIAAELSRVPGLSVALADRMPLAGTWTPPMIVDGPARRTVARTLANRVSAQYFSTLGVPVVRGRGFHDPGPRDAAVALISERAAQRFWPGEDPLGRSFALDMNFNGAMQTFQVIGVVRDVRTANLSRIDPSYVYLPLEASGQDHVIVRSTMGPREAAARIRAAVGAVDAALVGDLQVTSLDDGPLRLWRSLVATLAAFAATLSAIALGLAVAGIYGIVSYLAAARRHEIGVRMALGAERRDVLWLVVADALGPVAIGAGAGLALALLLSALVRSSLNFPGTPDVLYGVSPFDLVTFGAVTVLLPS